MARPPQFNLNNLNDDNQFLCVRGSFVSVNSKDADNRPTRGQLKSYYSKSVTNVPVEILNTGNIQSIEGYLSQHIEELNQKELGHLTERIEVMNHFNALENFYRSNRRQSVGPMQVNNRGQKVFPGIVLDRRQDTGNGCWSCAFSMLLKGRGVDLDQKLIRRYRPEFTRGNEVLSPLQTDIINSNMTSEIYQYSSLVDKVCPNTKMCKMNRSTYGSSEAQIRTQVIKALREKNAPVAFCNGYHWTTIVGVNDAGNTFYVVDSQSNVPGAIKEVNTNTYLSDPNAEFVWMEDIVLERDGRSPQLPENAFTLDPDTGSVIPKIQGSIEEGANNMSTRGNHIIDTATSIESYVPRMIRNYDVPYEDQKARSDSFLTENGVVLQEAPGPVRYTPISGNGLNAVKARLEQQVEINVLTARKVYLRDNCGFSQNEIDNMTPEEANGYYQQMRQEPLPVAENPVNEENEFSIFNQLSGKYTPPVKGQNDPDIGDFFLFSKDQTNFGTGDYMTEDQYAEFLKSLGTTDQVPEKSKGSTGDYMTDKQYAEFLKSLDSNDQISEKSRGTTHQVSEKNKETAPKQPEKPLSQNKVQASTGDSEDIYRDIAEQRYTLYISKMQAAKKNCIAPAQRRLMEDIALSEYSLGAITASYIKASKEDRALYRDSLVDEMGSYLTRLTVSKKLESVDLKLDTNIAEVLTSDENMANYEKTISASPAVAAMVDRLLKNPEDIFFMNSNEAFSDFVAEHSKAIKAEQSKKAPEKTDELQKSEPKKTDELKKSEQTKIL